MAQHELTLSAAYIQFIATIGDIGTESDSVVQGDIYVEEGGEKKPIAHMTGKTVEEYNEEYVPIGR